MHFSYNMCMHLSFFHDDFPFIHMVCQFFFHLISMKCTVLGEMYHIFIHLYRERLTECWQAWVIEVNII